MPACFLFPAGLFPAAWLGWLLAPASPGTAKVLSQLPEEPHPGSVSPSARGTAPFLPPAQFQGPNSSRWWPCVLHCDSFTSSPCRPCFKAFQGFAPDQICPSSPCALHPVIGFISSIQPRPGCSPSLYVTVLALAVPLRA